jgi:hypothetical protein
VAGLSGRCGWSPSRCGWSRGRCGWSRTRNGMVRGTDHVGGSQTGGIVWMERTVDVSDRKTGTRSAMALQGERTGKV